MKPIARRLMALLIYFFTPVDSTGPVRYGILSAGTDAAALDYGVVKVLFWILNAWGLAFLLSQL